MHRPAGHPSNMLGPLPPRSGPYRILAVSGSLRTHSSNALALKAVAALAGAPFDVRLYADLGLLPHFNPDLDTDGDRPGAVAHWRAAIAAADALLLSSPEYAHGPPGTLKNALDWLVSGPEFPALPVALLNTSPRASHAQAALVETIRTMSGELLTPPVWTLPLSGQSLDLEKVLNQPDLVGPLQSLLTALEHAVERARASGRRLIGPTGVQGTS